MKLYRTGQIAKLVGVAPRTVSKWFDSGKLSGYRIPSPGSKSKSLGDRRIPEESLRKFLSEHGMPTIEEFQRKTEPSNPSVSS